MRRKVMLALVAVTCLGLGSMVVQRELVQAQLVDEARRLAEDTFARPTHAKSSESTVRACIDRERPPKSLHVVPLFELDAGLTDGGARWLEEASPLVDHLLPCFAAPAVGGFDEFGFECLPEDRTSLLTGMSAVLGARLKRSDRSRDLETCSALIVVERDSVALAGLIGAMSASGQARTKLTRCVEAVARSSSAERAPLRAALESARRLPPFSEVLRIERVAGGVAILGPALREGVREDLPPVARRCVGTLSDDTMLTKVRSWLYLPTYWNTLGELAALSATDPSLSGARAEQAFAEAERTERLLFLGAAPQQWQGFSRRYGDLNKGLEALRAVVDHLDGRPTAPEPWMTLEFDGGVLTLTVQFEDGARTIVVDGQLDAGAPSPSHDAPGR